MRNKIQDYDVALHAREEFNYFAFNPSGTRVIAGPFRTRLEAARFSKKAGMACRYCGRFSGGMTICRSCLCIILSPKKVMARTNRRARKEG